MLGTGKTIAFLIPSIELLVKEKLRQVESKGTVAPMILIISPTRELVLQIAAEAAELSTFHKLSIATLVGGTNVNTDIRIISQPKLDLVIATPGNVLMLYSF